MHYIVEYKTRSGKVKRVKILANSMTEALSTYSYCRDLIGAQEMVSCTPENYLKKS